MTPTPIDTAVPAADPVVTFTRTIDRSLVHRAAVSEVLVTDLVRTGHENFVAGAQLPLGHSYFSDHLRTPVTYDFLLLLEAARQAGIAASHRLLGVAQDTSFLVNDWSIEIEDLPALVPRAQPAELELTGVATLLAGRNGHVRGVGSSATLRVAGRVIGRTRINAGTARTCDYGKLRFLQRKSVPPLTGGLGPMTRGRPANAADVGRRSWANVVLGEPLRSGGAVSARVEPRFDNSALFDHSYDHIPAMVLTEAARQLAHLAGAPAQAAVTGCTAAFTRFAELDAPLVATARPYTARPHAARSGEARLIGCTVDFQQAGTAIGRIELTFTPPPSRVALPTREES
jgi:hypothetical protein